MDRNESGPLRPVFSRRLALAIGGGSAVAAALGACSDNSGAPTEATGTSPDGGVTTTPSSGSMAGSANAATFGGGGGDGTVKIGFTVPTTGALAGFGEANDFILGTIDELVRDGIMLGDKSYAVEIIVKDVESDAGTAAARASELIVDGGVDLILSVATPGVVNPVADQCEANGVPCLSTLAPWQPYFFGRGGDPAGGFNWTFHFFWGTDQLCGVFREMWDSIDTNKVVGLLCGNDPDGNALADVNTGFPAVAAAGGYTVVDPGRFQVLADDFSDIIGQFKSEGVEIVAGVPLSPDFATFWTQADQLGFNPKIVTMANAVLLASNVEALGDLGDGLSTEVWWSPTHPFESSLTGESAADLAAAWTASSGKQWTQLLGFTHALFEECFDILARAGSTDKQAIAAAAAATDLTTIVGPLKYGAFGLPRNIAATGLVGGQWQQQDGGGYPFDLVVTDNGLAPEIPITGELEALA
jgi:branched-chain amino acid transport system substrate-binding protein